jgi:hypothetical protein
MAGAETEHRGAHLWTTVVFALAAPFTVILCLTLWRSPFPVTEAVAIFENVSNTSANLWLPDTSYYRPLFYLTVSAIWHNAGSLEAALAWLKLVQIVAVLLLIALFIVHLRPRTFLDAAAALVAVAVLIGSPGFRDNLELPLSYTTIGLPLVLIVWMVLNREPRPWHAPVIVVLTLIAIGFKEQGLVIIPVVIAAWWMRAPGATRGLATALTAIAIAYVVFRLNWRAEWPVFEQAIGLGFTEIEVPEATARFGSFPYLVYANNAASTIAALLFAEPARGVFRILDAWSHGRAQAWQFVHVGSSIALTGVIAWWGVISLRNRCGWSAESRTFVALIVALVACGVLSFNYSRERLAGMAVVFYALAGFLAMRAAASRLLQASPGRFSLAAVAVVVLALAWQTRAIATIEYVRATAWRSHMEWLVMLPERRAEFAQRPPYLRIMNSMIDQGTNPASPRPTRYPSWVALTIGQP